MSEKKAKRKGVMIERKLQEQLDGLLEKYTELLLGRTDKELQEQVKMWIVYSHIAKSMPPLVKHWNHTYPDAKEGIKEVIQSIKKMNEAHRADQQK